MFRPLAHKGIPPKDHGRCQGKAGVAVPLVATDSFTPKGAAMAYANARTFQTHMLSRMHVVFQDLMLFYNLKGFVPCF